jgi:hypothetical protein
MIIHFQTIRKPEECKMKGSNVQKVAARVGRAVGSRVGRSATGGELGYRDVARLFNELGIHQSLTANPAIAATV